MGFWSLGGSRAAPVADVAVRPHDAGDASQLEPIRVFTATGEYRGMINSRGQRVTDLLNTQPALLVLLDDPGASEQWASIDRDTILVVAPPPFASQRRIHRQRRSVQVKVGGQVVSGAVHTPPMGGVDHTQLRARQRFLPVTNVRITSADGSADGEEFAVAIVNLSNVDELREVSLA